MAKSSISYECNSCQATFPRWVGKCGKCGEFGTVVEVLAAGRGGSVGSAKVGSVGIKGSMTPTAVTRHAKRVSEVNPEKKKHTSTGIGELDRVLGGGLVSGQAVLIAGEPGVGKSTLLLSLAQNYAATGKTVLYASGEESVEQIAIRAQRTGANADTLYIADETDLSVILGHIQEINPDLVIVDSVQTIASPDVDGRAGGIAQVQEVSATLTRVAKATHVPFVIVAQVTKDGNIAGPKTLEHLVDTVLFFEGDRNTSLRLLRTVKNRFGQADEVAAFEQTESGINEVPDPSGLFLTGREEPVAGTCITVAMEGKRALLAEIQALVSPTNAPNPRRGVSGLDSQRMAMLTAVTERHGRIRMFDKDSFLATVAGMKITEPAADLAVCLALASAAWDKPIAQDVIALGEVALSGDVRPISNLSQRISEAARLGFKRILVPVGSKKTLTTNKGVVIIEVANLAKAFQALNQMSPPSSKDN
jgi:DNA repair protein RadA/Sms